MRIAMWSGPRNLSTATMYAFAARGDCAVVDEPFYAAYLASTGLDHPMRQEILASQPQDPTVVAETLIGDAPERQHHFYQKHMCQHMITTVPRSWMRDVVNVFLIRHPARVVASFSAKREEPGFDELGYRQQAELYDFAMSLGQRPVVVDSRAIRSDPERALTRLCECIGIPFTQKMLRWPAGGHPSDGVWAPHWYGSVHTSTGFDGPEGTLPVLRGRDAALSEQAMPYYARLKAVAEEFSLA
jgi:hypothetical protein